MHGCDDTTVAAMAPVRSFLTDVLHYMSFILLYLQIAPMRYHILLI
jgi:hypothetical protein